MNQDVKLTAFSHGGGCGCKISPAVLERILAEVPKNGLPYPDLLVGLENGDDAAVHRIGGGMAVVATTDFFMPIVDDPYEFGRIAATNAISDVYAMGARPILALSILAMPIDKLAESVIREVIRGGLSVCATAGIPLAGGHSIDSVEPIYGLVVLGLIEESRIQRNDRARPGDLLILGKPIGVGILSAALKKGSLSPSGYAAMVSTTTRLNAAGPELAEIGGVHAMTDVTGFGLLGHCWEMCRGANASARLAFNDLPIIPEALALAKAGTVTGASGRNWASYGENIDLPKEMADWQRALMTDPQTSGGLLVACAPNAADQVLSCFGRHGSSDAAVIGRLEDGPARIRLDGHV